MASAPATSDLQTVLEALDTAAGGGGDSANYQTLSANKTLTDADVKYQMLDPNSQNRTINLPVTASVGKVFVIKNTAAVGQNFYLFIATNGFEIARIYPRSTVAMLWKENYVWESISINGEGNPNAFGAHKRTVQIGSGARAVDTDGVAVGTSCVATSANAVAIGVSCTATGNYPIAIGSAAATSGTGWNPIAIGRQALAADSGVSIGWTANTEGGQDGVAIGNAAAGSYEGCAIGHETIASYDCVAVGCNAVAETPAVTDKYRIAIGAGDSKYADATARTFGPTVKAGAACGIALGGDTYVNQDYGIAIGYQAKCDKEGAVVLGRVASGTNLSASENYAVHGNRFHAEADIILKESSEPTAITDKGQLYAKENGTGTDLYWKNGADDDEVQVTNGAYTPKTWDTYSLHHVIEAGSLVLGPTAPSKVAKDTAILLAFAADAEQVGIEYEIPDEWIGTSDIVLKIYWTFEDGDAPLLNETVKWNIRYRCITWGTDHIDNGTAVTGLATYTEAGDPAGDDKATVVSEITLDYDDGDQPLTAGDTIVMLLDRDVSGDSYTGHAAIAQIELVLDANSFPSHA